MTIEKVGVVGAGLMGSGIVETVARCGFDTIVREVDQAAMDGGMQRIQRSMGTAVERGKMADADRQEALGRIHPTTDLQQLADRDIVIEAATENVDVKKDLFRQLDEITRPEALLVTNS